MLGVNKVPCDKYSAVKQYWLKNMGAGISNQDLTNGEKVLVWIFVPFSSSTAGEGCKLFMSWECYQDKSIWEAFAYYPDEAIDKFVMKWLICFPWLKLSAGLFHWSFILKKDNKSKSFPIFFSTKYTQFLLQSGKKKKKSFKLFKNRKLALPRIFFLRIN